MASFPTHDLKLVCAIFGSNAINNKYNRGLEKLIKEVLVRFCDARLLIAYDDSSERFVSNLQKHENIIPIDMSAAALDGDTRMLWRLSIICEAMDGPGHYIPIDVDAADHRVCFKWISRCLTTHCKANVTDTFTYTRLLSQTRQYIQDFPVLCDFCETCFTVHCGTTWKNAYTRLMSRYGHCIGSRTDLARAHLNSDDVFDSIPHKNDGYGVDEMLLAIFANTLEKESGITTFDTARYCSPRLRLQHRS